MKMMKMMKLMKLKIEILMSGDIFEIKKEAFGNLKTT